MPWSSVNFLISLAAFLAAITILVFIHEYGHFKVARLCGVKVKRFSIGFGKPFWSRVDRHGTEWAVAPFPLGGYISMVDTRVETPAPGEEAFAFDRKSLWARSAIVLAGPLVNLLFAWVAWSVLLSSPTVELAPRLGAAMQGSDAAKAGFREGDMVSEVSGAPTRTLSEVHLALTRDAMSGIDSKLVVERSGSRAELVLPTGKLDPGKMASGEGLRTLGFASPGSAAFPAKILSTLKDSPADAAGLKAGDTVLSIDGTPIASWSAMIAIVASSEGKPLKFEVASASGSRREAMVTPRTPAGDPSPKIGAAVDSTLSAELRKNAYVAIERSPWTAMSEAAGRCYKFTKLTYQAIGTMLTGRSGADGISGPIGIAQQAGDAAAGGPLGFMHFLAFLSLSLFLMNLLPLPGLDGGHLTLFAIEAAIGRPLSEASQNFVAKIGFSMLGLLMVVAVFNDVSKLLR